MLWIVIIAVVIFVIYNIKKEHNEHVETHISRFGGMKEKFKVVIEYLENSGLHIARLTKDSIELSSKSASWSLDYVGNNLEVKMKAFLPLLGNVSKKWIFPDGYPQEKMIEEFNNYAEWQMKELQKIAENNPYQYLNNKN